MPKIVVTSRKPVLTSERGRLPMGIPVDVSGELARFLIEQGVAVLMETKERMDRPTVAAGSTAPSSALPVAPALPMTTSSESEPGDSTAPRKRGRPRKNPEA
jgi:hypothetical protein